MKLLVLLLLSSCAYFFPVPEAPQGRLNDMNYEELKKHLVKTESMAGKTFHITATPLTKNYVSKRLFNEIENLKEAELVSEMNKIYQEEKTCFELEFLIDRPGKKEAAKIKNWEGYVVDNQGKTHFLNWPSQDDLIKEKPSKNYFGKTVAYLNKGLACTDKLAIEDGLSLKLYLNKKLAPWPFSEKVSLNWNPIKFKKNHSGSLEYIEPPKKIKKAYRGW